MGRSPISVSPSLANKTSAQCRVIVFFFGSSVVSNRVSWGKQNKLVFMHIITMFLLRYRGMIGCWADIWVVVLQEVWNVIYWTVHNHILVPIAWWGWAKHSRLRWISTSHARTYCTRYIKYASLSSQLLLSNLSINLLPRCVNHCSSCSRMLHHVSDSFLFVNVKTLEPLEQSVH